MIECQKLSVFMGKIICFYGEANHNELSGLTGLFSILTPSSCFWVGFVTGHNVACQHITLPQLYPAQKQVVDQSITEAATSGSQDCGE